MLSHYCDAIAILCVAATTPLALDSAYTPLLDVRNSGMSLAPQPCDSIPEETIRVARAAFPHSTRLMQMRDHLGAIYHQSAFEALYPQRGKPAEAPWRLALITPSGALLRGLNQQSQSWHGLHSPAHCSNVGRRDRSSGYLGRVEQARDAQRNHVLPAERVV